MMFFELHDEKRIGYKLLSEADLGIKKSTHQTHIGLSEHVLSFLPNRDGISEDSIFIYNNKFEYIDAYFDRIENPNGTFRSPKIRIGDIGCVSIVSTIRQTAQTDGLDKKWFLFWFGLKNERVVYFLFNNDSEEFKYMSDLGLTLNKKGARTIDETSPVFSELTSYIEKKVNVNGLEILKELEVTTQTKNVIPNKKIKQYDIDKANDRIKRLGKKGEMLVNTYLFKQVCSGNILSYVWYNKDTESGLPYDFSIQDKHNNVSYLDVKTTGYDFNQKMIFSSQEIKFIATSNNAYCVYRVYMNNDDYYLRVCSGCKNISIKILDRIAAYTTDLNKLQVDLQSSKLAVSPENFSSELGSEIIISE